MANAKHYSTDFESLDFGVMIEVPRDSGQPKIAAEYIVETVILRLEDEGGWIITKSGRTLTKQFGDRFEIVEPTEPPLSYIYIPGEGELAYWFYGFNLDIIVPVNGQRFSLLTDYRHSETTLIPRGTLIEYHHTLMTRFVNEQHHNLIRYFTTTDGRLELSFYAIDCEKYMAPILLP